MEILVLGLKFVIAIYSETLNNEYIGRIYRVSKKKCDLRRLGQKCNFVCATLLYGVFFNIV